MSGSFVRIVGSGMSVVPVAPFGLRVVGDAVELSGLVDDEELQVKVRPGDTLPEALGELGEGPDTEGFVVQVGGVYQLPWPAELALVSSPEPDQPPFFMFSDLEGGLIYVQGPMETSTAPERSAMVGAGQREVDRGNDDGRAWIELGYDHDGVPWRQRHIVGAFGAEHRVIVTTQARAVSCHGIHAAASALAATLSPFQP